MDISNSMVLEAGEKDQEYAERMLAIPLSLAERAWAYAMQLKQEISDHPRRRFHLARRLKKASEHAQRFERLCHDPESPCSDRTKLEATAYAAYITGTYQVEREKWAEAKENLNKALSIYFAICVSIRKDDVLESYRQRIDELRASLRYCTFNLPEQITKSEVKFKLPTHLQFHDLAFRHLKQLQQETIEKRDAEKGSAMQTEVKPTEEESSDDEEFEETNEGENVAAEEDEDEGGDDGSLDKDEKGKDERQRGGTRAGGVTGLVKNWLGGAWS